MVDDGGNRRGSGAWRLAALLLVVVVGVVAARAAAVTGEHAAAPEVQVAPGAGLVVPAQAGGCSGYGGTVYLDFAQTQILPDVPVSLEQGGFEITRTTADDSGRFCLEAPAGDYLVNVELVDDTNGTTFIVERPHPGKALTAASAVGPVETVTLSTAVTSSDQGSAVDVYWAAAGGDSPRPTRSNLPRQITSKLVAQQYLNAIDFVRWAIDQGYVEFNEVIVAPPHVLMENVRPTPGDAPAYSYYSPSLVTGPGGNPLKTSFIGMDDVEDTDTLWHELTHYLSDIDGLLDVVYDTNPPDVKSHAGIENANTADSILEGYAVFLPGLFGVNGTDDGRPDEAYRGLGPLDTNEYKSYTEVAGGIQREDFAFGTLLWDLIDGDDSGDGRSDCVTRAEACDEVTFPAARSDGTFVDVTVRDEVTIAPSVVHAAIRQLPGDDATVAAFRQILMFEVDPILSTPSIDLDGTGAHLVAPIDVPFLMHGFHPCDRTVERCRYHLDAGSIGDTDTTDGATIVTDRRVEPYDPAAALRLVNDADVERVVSIVYTEAGVDRTVDWVLDAGETRTVPFELPPADGQALPGAPLPDCATIDDAAQVVARFTDDAPSSGQLTVDACSLERLIEDSNGQPAFTYLVGNASARYRIEFVDGPGAGVVTVDESLSFADLQTLIANTAAGIDGNELQVDGSIRLYVPALELLAPVDVTGAVVELQGAGSIAAGLEDFSARIRAQAVVGGEVVDVDLLLDFVDGDGSALETVEVALDLTSRDGDGVIDSDDVVALLGEIGAADPQAVADFAAALPPVSLDGLHADIAWTPTSVSVDAVADATIGDLGLGLLLSVDDSDTTDPRFLIGARFDNAADPTADTIELSALLGIPASDLSVDLDFPEFALASAFGGSGPITGADLRPAQSDFFGPDGLPDDLDLDGNLSFAASIEMSVFDGTGLDRLFTYTPTDTIDISGTLGFSLADLAAGGPSVTDLEITATLPAATGTDETLLPDWITIDGSTIGFRYADGAVGLFVQADATVAVDGQSLAIDAEVGVETDGSTTTLTFSGATNSAWTSPFGLEWLDIDSVGLDLTVTVDDSGVAVDGGLTSTFAIGGKDFAVAIDFESATDASSVAVRVALDDTISVDEVLALFGSPALPSQLGGITVGPVVITARVGTAGSGVTVTADGAVPINADLTLSGTLLISLEDDGQGGYDVVFGLRSDGVTMTELFGSDPLGLGTLPPIGLVGSSGPLAGTRSTLSPEEAAFYGPLLGCADPADTACQFELDLPSGIHLVSTVAVPGDPNDAATDLADIVKMVWVDPAKGVLLRASAPLPGSGAIDLSSLAIRLQLGIDPPPEVRAEFPWFDSADLAIEVDGGGLKLAGGLGIKLGKDTLTTQSACENDQRPGVWKESYPGSGTSACYDLLELELSAEIAFTAPPSLRFTGSLLTSGWYPVDFLRVDAAKLQIGVELAGSPVFTFGFLAQGGIQLGDIGKDFMGSAVIGLRTLPNPPFVVPEPKGIRLASQAGIELADVPKLYDYVVDTAEQTAASTGTSVQQLLGFDPPTSEELGIDPATLPNVSLRNIELMFGIGSFPDLCIEPGLIVSGELLINAPAIDVIPPPLPIADDCSELGPLTDPTQCSTKPECFASVQLRATLEGIVVSGALGPVDLGLVRCRDSLLDLRLTLETQRFLLSGGCDALIPSLDGSPPTVLASGDLAFSLGLDGISFRGDLRIFPEPPPPGFRILVEGQAALDFASIDFADPDALQAIDFDFHALLQADFGAEVDDSVVTLLEDLRLTAQVIDELWAEFRDSGGDPLEALISLPDILDELGEPVPAWVDGFAQGLEDFRDDLEFFGIETPTLDEILGGVTFQFEGLPGLDIFGNCYSFWPLPGTVVDGVCYSFPPGPVEIPGVCDLVPGTPCSVAELEDDIAAILKPVLTDIAGVPADQDLTLTALLDAIVGSIEPGGALFRLDCVDFRISTLDEADSKVALRVKAEVFGNPINFTLEWNLAADPLAEAGRFAEQVVNQLFGDPQPVQCEELGTTTVGLPIVGSPTPAPETLDDFELTVDGSVTENGTATATVEFNIVPPDPVDVTIDWGEGTPETVTVTDQRASFTHRYLDDDPTNTASDTYDVTVAAIGVTKTSGLTVRNAAPSAVTLTTTAVAEGGTATVTGRFTDPGTLDTHRVRIDWGDGSPLQTTALPAGARAFSFDHTYVDDDPTRTPADDYLVKVTVLDDDRGRGATAEPLRVTNVAPSGTTLTPAGVVEEGSVAEFTVAFTDPGDDTHTVTVDWGDGRPVERRIVPSGDRSFTTAHVYADDDPSGTPADDYTVKVVVADDDTGAFTSTFDVEVRNVDPVITPGPADGDTAIAINGTYDPADDVIDEDGTASVTVDFTDPGVPDRHTVVIDWGDGTSSTATSAPGIRQVTRSHRYLDDDPTATPEDRYPITVTVTDDDTGTDTATGELLVKDVAPAVETDTPSQAVQYSDPGETMTFTATDVEGDTLTAEVWFDEGSTASTAGLPSWLELSADGDCTTDSVANRRTCTWTVTPVPDPTTGIYTDADPGTYTVRLRITDDDTLFTDLSATIVVLPEDARAVYVGPTYAATDDFRDDTTTVELRAVVQDITLATDDPAWDPYPGDVLKATTRFVDREAGDALLCEATLGYTFADEIGLATAVCDWEADIGRSDARSWVIGTIVGDPGYDADGFELGDPATHADPAFGRYIRNQTDDDTVVLVARPIDESINGGGYLVLGDSAGVYEGDVDTKANFGFNVKFNKRGTNLQGQVTLIVRADDHVYRIKTNSLTSLGVVEIDGDGNGIAQFEAKANIVDVTDEHAPVSLGGNLTLQMRMTDLGEPGDADTIGFSLWDRDGALLFSSNWDEVQTIEQTLDGGNLTVHP